MLFELKFVLSFSYFIRPKFKNRLVVRATFLLLQQTTSYRFSFW